MALVIGEEIEFIQSRYTKGDRHIRLVNIIYFEVPMFGLGWPEVIVILGVGTLIFGSKKIPEMGSAFGKTLRSFKQGLTEPDMDDELDSEDSQPD